MKMVALTGIIVAGSLLSGFTPQLSLPPQRPRLTFAPMTVITADELPASSGVIHARGRVRIESSSTVITADEADIRRLNTSLEAVELSIDVRGNVNVSISPTAKP